MNATILHVLNEKLPSLSNAQKKLARFIKENFHRVPLLSGKELSKEAAVSAATVSRLVSILGCHNYSDFRAQISDLVQKDIVPFRKFKEFINETEMTSLGEVISQNQTVLSAMMQNKEIGQSINQALDLIDQSATVYITGARTSFSIAYYLAFMLEQLRSNVCLINPGSQFLTSILSRVQPEDCLISVAYAKYSSVTYEIVKYFNRQQCPVISITDSHFSPIAEKSDVILLSPNTETFSLAPGMVMANCLTTLCGQKQKKSSVNIMEKQDETADMFDVYL